METRTCGRCRTRPCAGTSSRRCTECKRLENQQYMSSLSAEERSAIFARKRGAPAARWRNNRKAGQLMPQEVYEATYAEQEGCCVICGGYQPVLVIDHCHETQAARGLLCSNCNVALGMLQHNPVVALRAAAYLEASR